ncbi:MAG TPA: RNA methyltransferase [Nitrososphaera sp.]
MPQLWVALPDSSISDEQTKRDKSIKIAQFARACSIFRVKRIYLYHDTMTQSEKSDALLLKTILEFLDTPQYLRKILYPRIPQLEYAGVLPPIKTPHHRPFENIKRVEAGDLRTGVIVKVRGQLYVEVGLGSLVPFLGDGFEGKKVNVKFSSSYPRLKAMQAGEDEILEYWGYEVKEVPSLSRLLRSIDKTEVIFTSRKGKNFKNSEAKLAISTKNVENILVVFGAPKYGIHEILANEGTTLNPSAFVINMFPNQATETVRIEEALLGSLAVLNSSLGL